ncbi:MAG: restriction endonuclease subunit S [Verrucomicrobia bacterium]|nr:restriction endonuclease subunit S [Verrucomicrobiota bacterium]
MRADAVLEYRKEQARRESFGGRRVFHYSIPAIQETGDGREENGAEIDSDKISLNGDELLVSKLNPRKGCVLISRRRDLPVVCSTEFVPLKARGCELRFAYYLYASQPVRDLISSTVQSVTRSHQRANPADIVKAWLAFPPDAEQAAIASFLDRETAKIDALVAKKERLIELLQEKRTALISHAVTQGLNPDAPMKDSGIPWLGRIPAHWEVTALKRNWEVIDCKHRTVPFVLEGVPVASIGEVQSFNLDLSNSNLTTRDEYLALIEGGRRPKRGDVIYSRNATVGAAAYVNTDAVFCMGQDVCLIRSPSNDQRFLVYQLRSPVVMRQLDSLALGVTFKRINVEQIKNLTLCCPTAAEQEDIAAYLDAEIAKLDALTAKMRTAIERLQEYRTALISAAVTGQIDVRQVSDLPNAAQPETSPG